MRRFLILTLVLLTGCFPDRVEPEPWMLDEAERVMTAYQVWNDVTLTSDEIACTLQFKIGWVSAEDFGRICHTDGPATACMYLDYSHLARRDFTLILDEDAWAETDWYYRVNLIRHEVTHLMLYCVEGDGDENHDSVYYQHSFIASVNEF